MTNGSTVRTVVRTTARKTFIPTRKGIVCRDKNIDMRMDDMNTIKKFIGGDNMNRKMVALVLAGMIVATVTTVLAWDDTDLDVHSGTWVTSISVVRANYDAQGKITAWDHDHDGGWKSGVTPPSGWYTTFVEDHGLASDNTYCYQWRREYAKDENNITQESVLSYARLP